MLQLLLCAQPGPSIRSPNDSLPASIWVSDHAHPAETFRLVLNSGLNYRIADAIVLPADLPPPANRPLLRSGV